jgi:hypothetical protein
MQAPSYIRSLRVANNRVDRDFDIDLTPTEGREFMHLILTGKNGSGKTSTLDFLYEATQPWRPPSTRFVFEVVPNWSGSKPSIDRVVRLGARRNVEFEQIKGPTKDTQFLKTSMLEQLLVNLRTQVAYAREEGDEPAAKKFEERLNQFEETFRELLAEPDLRLVFDRGEIRYRLGFNGRLVELSVLPDGFQSAIHIWAEIRSTIERLGDGDDWGIVLIDEVEGHLHLELQERLLPFLTKLFPRMQFIVTTHSPVVISSIDGAVIYDLSTHTRVISDELRGTRYGTLMTGHFGIGSDFDLKSAKELTELKGLHDKESRAPYEDARLRELAAKLSARSYPLAIEVWTELEFGDS